jgi:hypothetical protein
MLNGLVLLVVAIVVISAIVGAIAQFLNKLNEANAPPVRPEARGNGAPRQAQADMDRFLAEIDRLRRKNSETAETAERPQPQAKPVPQRPVPTRRPERAKPVRSVAEVVVDAPRRRVDSSPMLAPPIPVMPGTLSPDAKIDLATLPVASVVGGVSSTGAPSATRVTRLESIPGSKPQSRLDANLATLLVSPNGVVLATILREVLGPPKCKK